MYDPRKATGWGSGAELRKYVQFLQFDGFYSHSPAFTQEIMLGKTRGQNLEQKKIERWSKKTVKS